MGLNGRKDIKPINSFTKYMAPLVNSMFLTKIIGTELTDVDNQLPSKLSCSYDMSLKIIKLVISRISKPLTNIFNTSFLTELF